jgi:hypothetical protein
VPQKYCLQQAWVAYTDLSTTSRLTYLNAYILFYYKEKH